MRILFITARFPAPPIKGDKLRAFHQIKVLSRRHDIDLVSLSGPQDDTGCADLLSSCKTIEIAKSGVIPKMRYITEGLIRGNPLHTGLFDSPDFRHKIRLGLQKRPDVVHLSTIRVVPAFIAARGRTACPPTLLDMIDTLSLNLQRRSVMERNAVAVVLRWEAKRLAALEELACTTFERVLVTSESDKAALPHDAPVIVNPIGVEIERFRQAHKSPQHFTLLFHGNLAYFPNDDAAIHLVTEVFPLVRLALPDAELQIVGPNPSRRLLKTVSQTQGVAVTGLVPDIAKHLLHASVSVCPLRAGTGIQSKILEAMAAGIPVVATPLAASGLGPLGATSCIVGTTAQEIAQRVVWVANHREESRSLAMKAREMVRTAFSWERSVEVLEKAYLDMTATRNRLLP